MIELSTWLVYSKSSPCVLTWYPLPMRTIVTVDQGPLIWPHFTLITYIKALYPNAVHCEVPEGRTSTHKLGEDTVQHNNNYDFFVLQNQIH